MVTINIEGKCYNVNKKDNLLEICLSLGYNVPYFCWHPRLGSVGTCRQCAIKQHDNIYDKTGHIIMSCMTVPIEGSCFFINDIEVKQFRKSIIEFMMINHPHDCPVCDEGGSCHLQDMTVMSNHIKRRYIFEKKTYKNQYLGPFIAHNMNRCIKCYRCTRFYKDYAHGTDLNVFGANNNIYFGRFKDGVLKNFFSGNLLEVCPTGVFTDKTYAKHYARKWDLQYAPSICQHCSLGCNLHIGERYSFLANIQNRYNKYINHYFLCDKGRFGYGYINLVNRPTNIIMNNNKNNVICDNNIIMNNIANIIMKSKKIIGVGSPRASIESNFTLKKLVGEHNFFTGILLHEQQQINYYINILKNKNIFFPTLSEIETYDTIMIIGEDISVTNPRVALSVRQAIQNSYKNLATKIPSWHSNALKNVSSDKHNPLIITNIDHTHLDDIATWNYYAPLENQARFIHALLFYINHKRFDQHITDKTIYNKIIAITSILLNAKKCLFITGTNTSNIELLHATYLLLQTLYKKNLHVGFFMTLYTVNSMGINLIQGQPLENIFQITYPIDTMIIMENDLYFYEEKAKIDQFLKNIPNIVVLDHVYNSTTKKATIMLPVTNFIESSGTVINNECRAQRFFQVYKPTYYNINNQRQASWKWLSCINNIIHNISKKIILDDIINQCISSIPVLYNIKYAAPASNYRKYDNKFARSLIRYSGRTSMLAHKNIHEPIQPNDTDTMFNFSMEGNSSEHCLHMAYTWLPGWNSIQSLYKLHKHIDNIQDKALVKQKININNLNIHIQSIQIPKKFIPQHKLIIVTYCTLFFSNDLIQKSLLIQKHHNIHYAIFSRKDAAFLNIHDNNIIELYCLNNYFILNVKISDKLHPGLISLPLGIPTIPLCFLYKTIDHIRILRQ
ncbi:NADH-quinone oxidoreductase subunit NuoG [Enterobacteriaceae endosymbiont of Macroplea mutica]|uniref:NADH-quinone oxidoreductase subunit NuoG n=1 Tax=Enterobacteriaceae endosymbiont of Macroplea mutica TaxID=2675791 RepID=UPI0014495E97|nr:NADH-quinone oxidoreductase subunit NuoG [Enterobacteriaceae endosymbiont of Macroplea mutica]QJC31379.1 NADH-quinone oxidoreductase subunit NuoG [Enterobacteriaceae endosymbiont of Macroplea mutica]